MLETEKELYKKYGTITPESDIIVSDYGNVHEEFTVKELVDGVLEMIESIKAHKIRYMAGRKTVDSNIDRLKAGKKVTLGVF